MTYDIRSGAGMKIFLSGIFKENYQFITAYSCLTSVTRSNVKAVVLYIPAVFPACIISYGVEFSLMIIWGNS